MSKFEDEVWAALDTLRPRYPGSKLSAEFSGKVVTLTGEVADVATKGKIMAEFNAMVETGNTINRITIKKPAEQFGPPAPGAAKAPSAEQFGPPAPGAAKAPSAEQFGPPAPEAAGPRIHEVVKGDTLGAIAKTYYGSAGKYMKIFEANRDILDNPDLIKVGQKLKIPE